jgi:hypothetical protein
MLDDDGLCLHKGDVLEGIAPAGSAGPLAAVLVCGDCGAELKIWSGVPEPRHAAGGMSVPDVLKYHCP